MTSNGDADVRAQLEALLPEAPSMSGYATNALEQARRRKTRRVAESFGLAAASVAAVTVAIPAISAAVLDRTDVLRDPVAASTNESDPAPLGSRVVNPACGEKRSVSGFVEAFGPGVPSAKDVGFDHADAGESVTVDSVEDGSAVVVVRRTDDSVRAVLNVEYRGTSGWVLVAYARCADEPLDGLRP